MLYIVSSFYFLVTYTLKYHWIIAIYKRFTKYDHFLSILIGEEEQEEVKDAVADEPDFEDAPQENDEEAVHDEDDEQLEDEEENDENGKNKLYFTLL